jgi:Phage integrase, N-terminal SAM-like domain
LVERARELLQDGIATNTRRGYATATRSFTKFVRSFDQHRDVLPASPSDVALWITQLYNDGLLHTTIKGYLSGLRSAHVDEELDTTWRSSLRLQRVFRATKRHQTGRISKRKLPITFDVLRAITPTLSDSL